MASVRGPTPQNVVVVGSGVIGLTAALILARRGYAVEVVARNLPGDNLDQDWASPWAGANWCPFGTDPRVCRWEAETLEVLRGLIPTGLAMPLPITRFASTQAGLHNHCVGVTFTSVSVNSPHYLEWLGAQCTALGVVLRRATLQSLAEAVRPNTAAVVNATGLGAGQLADVKDDLVEPIRGQIVVVRAPVKRCVMDATMNHPTRSTYIIPRPNSGNQVICGGCYEVSSTVREPDPDMTRSILEHCLARIPELSKDGTVEGIEIVRECVGFRPSRRGGPRLEREDKRFGSRRVPVVHAYGIGPAGYQASWGMAAEAVKLVGDALVEGLKVEAPRARL
ncbi:hypothetical protein CcaverHIS002_0304290 [Cutaneotrichosporon cavernicola]|uniref:FAD dependent oxidoreductase domain-containing protein n=1 Tax=Cutaneotrichosporon cavernicola TaxID=279322 RepID=A0AA48I3C0_9TREE|nr:uncharacterized protein CcaverHIS019_0304260 [Cutaneotrichosporon cavernicola]BEI82561.1 hypothetical protein CcaverHIS002_0304290 [Cutaneotrichosporon cavernicola]BEI90356.1 hypothetical protein CcaverHIS019_0304260 [Cutaneotrichosporon cavernicola]BEI98132.1 hypothetical protein CcaverHIS631_0304310 [Cutaneotrichosporon cavernicola]BEJ05909.1 hypothetical protein CcaverHIS641_0304310 [Cutaneotrichosporon cavernicola]